MALLLRAGACRRLAASAAPRALSTKVVAHLVGPDRVGVVKEVNMCILGLGGKVTDTRAVTLDGTFSVSSTVELANDSCNLAWALQTRLPDYLTVVRPESSPGSTTGGVFGRVEVVNAKTAGAISQLTEHIASRGMSFATFRSSQETSTGSTGAETFTATGTLYASSSTPPISFEWVSQEFAELADKLDLEITFEKMK